MKAYKGFNKDMTCRDFQYEERKTYHEVTSRDGLAVSSGYQSKARASVGSAICLCERGEWNGESYPLIAVKAAIIDGKNLKPDTWYTLRNGEFVECEDDTDD